MYFFSVQRGKKANVTPAVYHYCKKKENKTPYQPVWTAWYKKAKNDPFTITFCALNVVKPFAI